MAVTSSLPRCRYCNIARPHHFWTECPFRKCCYIARLPCYRCGTERPDHVPEGCWTLMMDVTLEVCQQGLELRQTVMQQRQDVHLWNLPDWTLSGIMCRVQATGLREVWAEVHGSGSKVAPLLWRYRCDLQQEISHQWASSLS